jgi:5-methylcytosine-specific restriction endonuclease McrA
MNRPCLDCRRLIASGSRCPVCAWKKNAAYSPDRPRGRAWMKKRRRIMARADGICERCRNRLAEEIHHIDGDVTNNCFENLVAACRPCHLALGRENRKA